jgi:hypothetical protein
VDYGGYTDLQELFTKELEKQKKLLIEREKTITEKKITSKELLQTTSDVLSELTANKVSKLSLGTNLANFLERVNLGKSTPTSDLADLDELLQNTSASTKTIMAAVEYAGTLAGIKLYQLTSQYFTITPNMSSIATSLARGFLEYSGLVSEIANLKETKEDLLSYNLFRPMILGCVSSIYGELAKSFPNILPEVQSEDLPPPSKNGGLWDSFVHTFNPFISDFKKAQSSAKDTYDQYSEIFYKTDPQERKKMINELAKNQKIGIYRKTVMELISSSNYLSLPTATITTTIKYLSTAKGFVYNTVLGGAKSNTDIFISGCRGIIRGINSLTSRLKEEKQEEVDSPKAPTT